MFKPRAQHLNYTYVIRKLCSLRYVCLISLKLFVKFVLKGNNFSTIKDNERAVHSTRIIYKLTN
jgi:hypothetical protein